MSIRLISFAVAASSLACAGGALAQFRGVPAPGRPGQEVVVAGRDHPPGTLLRSQAVYYGDLHVDSRSGAQTLMNRITAAARQVCSPRGRARFHDTADFNRCMNDAVAQAVDNTGAPALNDLYQARYAYRRTWRR